MRKLFIVCLIILLTSCRTQATKPNETNEIVKYGNTEFITKEDTIKFCEEFDNMLKSLDEKTDIIIDNKTSEIMHEVLDE